MFRPRKENVQSKIVQTVISIANSYDDLDVEGNVGSFEIKPKTKQKKNNIFNLLMVSKLT